MSIPLYAHATGSRLAVLFSEQLCVHSSGREPLWLSVLLSVLRIGSRVQRTSRLLSLPASLSPPPTLLSSLHILQKTHWRYQAHTKIYKRKWRSYMENALAVIDWNLICILQYAIFVPPSFDSFPLFISLVFLFFPDSLCLLSSSPPSCVH